jgi:hypothetical protein
MKKENNIEEKSLNLENKLKKVENGTQRKRINGIAVGCAAILTLFGISYIIDNPGSKQPKYKIKGNVFLISVYYERSPGSYAVIDIDGDGKFDIVKSTERADPYVKFYATGFERYATSTRSKKLTPESRTSIDRLLEANTDVSYLFENSKFSSNEN